MHGSNCKIHELKHNRIVTFLLQESIMNTIKISVGDSMRGYDSAKMQKTTTGKYRLVPGSVAGRESVIRKSIASLNRGEDSYVTSSGDYMKIQVSNR